MPRDKFQAMLNCITRLNGLADFFHLAGLSSAANNSSLSRRRCTSAIVSNKCQLSQMDPRDELPHLHRSVHRGEPPGAIIGPKLVGQASTTQRSILVGPWKNFPSAQFRTKFQKDVPLFLEIFKFPYNTMWDRTKDEKRLPNPNPLDLFR